jgi:hypothetical protein
MSLINEADLEIAEQKCKHEIIDWLECKTSELLHEVQKQEFWTFVMSETADPKAIVALMREIYLEIVGYQPDVIEAAIAAIGQMPRSMNPRLVKSMLVHQADEFDHGEMALRDFIGLGGTEAIGRSRRISPEAFAVAAVWSFIAKKRDPFVYLGALYLFEGLTPTVTGLVKDKLRAKGLTARSLEYIEFHSTEDVKHANLVNHLIATIAETYPESVDSITFGFQCFRAVYPIPLWQAAFDRSRTATNASY